MKGEKGMLDLGSNLPLGFCSECVKRMAAGAFYEKVSVRPGGSEVMHAYCSHNQAGGVMILRADLPLRWSIVQPVDVLDWPTLVALKLKALKDLELAGKTESASVQTSAHPAPEVLQ